MRTVHIIATPHIIAKLHKTCESVVRTELVTTKSRFDAGLGTQVNLNLHIAQLPLRIDSAKHMIAHSCVWAHVNFRKLRTVSHNMLKLDDTKALKFHWKY